MGEINKLYQEIIGKCKFIPKPDEWFIEGIEVVCPDKCNYFDYENGDKFNSGWGLFEGYTYETFEGFDGELPRLDSETSSFEEFFIYDEFGNEISELTLKKYYKLIKK